MTKLKGDIAEQAVIFHSLKRGYGVLQPIGDRMPYDLVLDVGSNLVKVQVKSAWRDTKGASYVVDARRTKTNRREMIRDYYGEGDFDFLIAYIEDFELFYIIPFEAYDSYASSIHLAADNRLSRFPRTWEYREAWYLIEEQKENPPVRSSVGLNPDRKPSFGRH